MIRLAVLGSTGSIGTQTLEVAKSFPQEVEVTALCAGRPSERFLAQIKEFRPKVVTTADEPPSEWLRDLPEGTEYLPYREGLEACISLADRVMNAVSGVHGVEPAYLTLKMGKTLLASNKESILCLGEIMDLPRDRIIPVDSEHNALFQILEGVDKRDVRFIYLTASGGPFRNWTLEEMRKATPQQALNHPRWNMGAKITVDSATLMNKGFEMLEAKNLFDIELDRIKVVIHPQSAVHGMVSLIDGSFLMHASATDMRVPILHALFYPRRMPSTVDIPSPTDLSPISFEEVDGERFPCLYLARWAGEMGGAYVPALVGADEEAVNLFLEGKIGFLDIPALIEEVLSSVSLKDPEDLEGILSVIEWSREKAKELSQKTYSSGGTS